MDRASILKQRISGFDGEIHMMVRSFDGREFCHNADEPTDPMSVIKLAYLYEAFQTLDMSETVTIDHDDQAGGTGILMRLAGPVTLSMLDVATLMITLSDNVATDFLLSRLDRQAMARRLEQMGLTSTYAWNGFGSACAPAASDRPNTTTPRDIVTLLRHIGDDERMLSILAKQQDRTIIHHFLPDDVKRYTKSGQHGQVRNDAGIVAWDGGGAQIGLFGIRNTPAGNVRGLLEYDMQLAPIAEAAYLWARNGE